MHLGAAPGGVNRSALSQPKQQLPNAESAHWVAPAGRNLGERREHEPAAAELGMGKGRQAAPAALRPEDDVEVEHARAPAAAAAPAEVALDALERVEQLVGG